VQLGKLAEAGELATVGGVTRWADPRPRKSAEAMNRSIARADLPEERILQGIRE
jgi:hypothetical protein